MALNIVILAAGQGLRMRSSLPKVLHPLANKPLLHHVAQTAFSLQPQAVYVVAGHQYDTLRAHSEHLDLQWLRQKELLGTAHAVATALPELTSSERVLVLYGDIPLVSTAVLTTLLEQTPIDGLGLVLAQVDNPVGLGRVIRDNTQQIIAIVEEKDATPEQRQIKETFAGLLVAPVAALQRWLPKVTHNNAQQEYYLTDIIAMAKQDETPIEGVLATPAYQVQGVNDRAQLAYLERCYQRQQSMQLMQQGVTLLDPARVDIRGDVSIGQDTVIDANVVLSGQVTIGSQCIIDSHVKLHNVSIADNVHIKAFSMISDSHIAKHCVVGPFAHLRPGTRLASGVHIGNFVELKQSQVAAGSKINHHSYIGDTIVGEDVNIGAGTITCNYDGAHKHPTTIGDKVFVGSNSNLVAPINIGEHATIGAGSTLRHDVPANALVTNPVTEKIKKDWLRPSKRPKE